MGLSDYVTTDDMIQIGMGVHYMEFTAIPRNEECQISGCGRSQKDRPAIFKGEPWCSDICRKLFQGFENENEWRTFVNSLTPEHRERLHLTAV